MTNPEIPTHTIPKEKGEALIALARTTIGEKLGLDVPLSKTAAKQLEDAFFETKRGMFVTLTMDNELRGCMGNLSADESIRHGVKSNALNAAFHDPRFPPLSRDEFEKTEVEISLLTEPEPLTFSGPEELLSQLRPTIDGVILRKEAASSTFLPQVWEQLPGKEVFLEHLCRKAGLPGNAWQKPGITVLTYQVQYFPGKR